MANWKKVLVSGSSIEVASITASAVSLNNDTSFRTLMIDPATGRIFRTGSYGGGGGGGSLEALTEGAGIVDFSYDGGTPTTVAVSGAAALTSNTFTKWDGSAFANTSLTSANSSITSSGIINSSAAITASGFKGDGSNITGVTVDTASYTSIWSLGAVGTDHYTITGPGLTGAENDPDIYLTRGEVYKFNNDNSGGAHPFQIQTIGGSAYGDGVTNNGGAGGTSIEIDVQFDAPTKLFYQCTSHANMRGIIYIADAINHSGSFSGSFQGDGSGLTGLTNVTASKLENALTDLSGGGLNDFTFNGSEAIQLEVSGAAQLTTEKLVKWDGTSTKFVDSKITEGTNLITIGISTDEVKIPGDLRVQGTASFQNSTTLLVEDRYILINSGSTSGNQGGIVVQTENTQNVGQLFGYNDSTSRWAIKSAFDAETTTDFNPQAYMGLTSGSAIANPNAAGASGVNETIIKQSGNIYVNNSTEDIWIYS